MTRVMVGVVDYGLGNQASVMQAMHTAGFRVCKGAEASTLDACDVLVLPGVGAFPEAMLRLTESGLANYLRQAAASGRALLGICLGMQLLAGSSSEYGHSEGLAILPGRVVPLCTPVRHIGWNILTCVGDDPVFRQSDGHAFYFNHSFVLKCDDVRDVVAVTSLAHPMTAAVRRGKVAGLQFHPEKSQEAGIQLLSGLITELAND